jgi:carbon monoxide dehydrogenase subunit G
VPEFRSHNRSTPVVPVPPDQMWEVLTDPELLAKVSPLVTRIEARGDRWSWTLAGIPGLGFEIAPTFTERMTFVPISRIDCVHEPQPGRSERAGLDGTYLITKVDDGSSKLVTDLTLSVELPLPGFSRLFVEGVMGRAMRRASDAFARNLYRHLGLDPASVPI